MKFELKNAATFQWDGLKGWAYNTKEEFDNASAACFEVTHKGHGKVKTTRSDRVYFVLDGTGEFSIDSKLFRIKKSDVVIVPKTPPTITKHLRV